MSLRLKWGNVALGLLALTLSFVVACVSAAFVKYGLNRQLWPGGGVSPRPLFLLIS